MVFQEEERGDIACGADRQVINSIEGEGVGGEGVAASAIGDDVVESDDAIDVRVWREGVGAITVVGNEAASGRETKDGECLSGAGIVGDISVGVTGEEISGGDVVGEIFRAVGESCFNASQLRDVVNRSQSKRVGGSSFSGAVGDVVVEGDGAVEIGIR